MLKLTSSRGSVRRAVLGLGALLAATALAPAGASAQEGPAYRDRDKRVDPLINRVTPVRTSEGSSGDHTVAVRVHLGCRPNKRAADRHNKKAANGGCLYRVHVEPGSANEPSDYFAWWGYRGDPRRDNLKKEWKEVFLKDGRAVDIALYVKVFGDTEVEADETFDVWIYEYGQNCRNGSFYYWNTYCPASDFRGVGTIVNDDRA